MTRTDIAGLIRAGKVLYVHLAGTDKEGNELINMAYNAGLCDNRTEIVRGADFRAAFRDVRGTNVKW